MKQWITAALILICLSSQAQELRFDTANAMTYVNIEPVVWKRNKPMVTRLYVMVASDNLMNSGVLMWQLRDSTYIDANTTNRSVIDNGRYQLTADDYDSWDPDSKYLFLRVSELLNVTIKE